ncbi:hypothetical protein KM043_009194 [Ampulex compressa]|nr:hypothetical protein KM043_009194 [Ampulex compressa]
MGSLIKGFKAGSGAARFTKWVWSNAVGSEIKTVRGTAPSSVSTPIRAEPAESVLVAVYARPSPFSRHEEGAEGVIGVDVRGVVTYREEPSRDISIATRLRVRDKPDPHSSGCRLPQPPLDDPPPR